jgi:hypothetical protein
MSKDKILRDAIKTFGVDSQIDMAIEEMSELTKALLKMRRISNGHATVSEKFTQSKTAFFDISEEMADVKIMMQQLEMIFANTDEVLELEKQKIERLQQKLNLYVD